MVPVSEILTALATGVSVVALSIGATLYVTKESDQDKAVVDQVNADQAIASARRFDIGDAYFSCRDQIQAELPYPVRNVNVDSHSSRYDDLRNDNVVFIDLELMEGQVDDAKDAQIVCRVSAANNEITSFQLRKS